MEDGVADDHVRAGIVERHMLDGFNSEIRLRKRGREPSREGADAIHSLRVRVDGINFVPLPQQVDEVSTGAAPCVQYSHSGRDAAFQKLVEKIDVDLAELLLERGYGHFYKDVGARRLIGSTGSTPNRLVSELSGSAFSAKLLFGGSHSQVTYPRYLTTL